MADRTIILAGNPNVGKSVLFNKLTGRYAVVSNYPGTTVDVSRGVALFGGKNTQVIDTPGTNSLLPSSEDEQVTRDVLLREMPDVVVQVADTKNLKRSLFLTLELMELNLPMVLVLNMYDEALERGIRVDREKLERLLGIPVVEAIGIQGKGVSEIRKKAMAPARGTLPIRYAGEVEAIIESICREISGKTACSRALALMLLAGDEGSWRYVEEPLRAVLRDRLRKAVEKHGMHPGALIFQSRNDLVNGLVAEVMSNGPEKRRRWLELLGDITMRSFPGYLIALLVLFIMYEFVGVFAAGTLVNLLESKLFGGIINPWLTGLVNQLFPWQLARDFLVGPYGMLTMAMTYALAIVFPIVGAFFIFFGFLEDSGYLPRLSVMLDRVFRTFGLNGKAVLPMVLGLGCGTMAVMGARILETRKERLMVLLLLSLTIPCSAQLGVILGLLAGLSWKVTVLWLGSLLGSLLFVGSIVNRLLPGAQAPFVLEIPPLRWPAFSNILIKVKMRIVWYLQEAVPLFILGTAILFVCDKLRLLQLVEKAASPVIVRFLGLPVEVTQTFILGFMRRDYGAAGLFTLANNGLLSAHQVLVSAVAITLFVPCVAQCFMVAKEQGWKIAALIFLFVSAYAMLLAGALHWTVTALHLL